MTYNMITLTFFQNTIKKIHFHFKWTTLFFHFCLIINFWICVNNSFENNFAIAIGALNYARYFLPCLTWDVWDMFYFGKIAVTVEFFKTAYTINISQLCMKKATLIYAISPRHKSDILIFFNTYHHKSILKTQTSQ